MHPPISETYFSRGSKYPPERTEEPARKGEKNAAEGMGIAGCRKTIEGKGGEETVDNIEIVASPLATRACISVAVTNDIVARFTYPREEIFVARRWRIRAVRLHARQYITRVIQFVGIYWPSIPVQAPVESASSIVLALCPTFTVHPRPFPTIA